jgi:hypothetical protein
MLHTLSDTALALYQALDRNSGRLQYRTSHRMNLWQGVSDRHTQCSSVLTAEFEAACSLSVRRIFSAHRFRIAVRDANIVTTISLLVSAFAYT